ncbi:MAG TPA: GNAT family N-acetyltransferase [Candidatus Dormibacteraeota bacterium]|nr:GNAT family N-acetyltransferase [Candidatus Dormibacteraeota bacterium]
MGELAWSAEIEVDAPPDAVWDAITNPELTRRYVFGCDIEGEWRPGAPWRYQAGGRAVIVGTVLEADPPRLLRLTASNLWDPAAREDPPYRITWQVAPARGGRTRVRLTHDGFVDENASYRDSADLEPVLGGLRNLVDPEAAAAVRRLDAIGRAEVLPLTSERLNDFLDLFDNRAFADNPSWAWCYCYNFRFAGGEAEGIGRTAADNRRDMGDAIVRGRAHGLLAYVDGRAVGWCSACPKSEMPGLVGRDWMPPEADRVGIIGCLVVAPQYRRHGIARLLVEAAGEYLAGLGCRVAEAYPLRELDADAHGHYGPLAAYRDLGYETYRELPQRLILRKPLAAGDQ